jgi:hypothetical protein
MTTEEKLYYLLRRVADPKLLDLEERQRKAYKNLFEVESVLLDLVRLGIHPRSIRLHTQGPPAFGGGRYLTEAQVEFDKIKKNLWLAKDPWGGGEATGRTQEKAYKNFVKKHKIIQFSEED